MSTADGELVAQGVLNGTSLLDALFCLEPYRNNGHDLSTTIMSIYMTLLLRGHCAVDYMEANKKDKTRGPSS